MTPQDWTLFGIKVLFALVALALIVAFLVRPVLRVLFTKPDILEFTQAYAGSEVLDEEELEIPSGGGKPDRYTMLEEARSDPRRAAAFISAWLKDKR